MKVQCKRCIIIHHISSNFRISYYNRYCICKFQTHFKSSIYNTSGSLWESRLGTKPVSSCTVPAQTQLYDNCWLLWIISSIRTVLNSTVDEWRYFLRAFFIFRFFSDWLKRVTQHSVQFCTFAIHFNECWWWISRAETIYYYKVCITFAINESQIFWDFGPLNYYFNITFSAKPARLKI